MVIQMVIQLQIWIKSKLFYLPCEIFAELLHLFAGVPDLDSVIFTTTDNSRSIGTEGNTSDTGSMSRDRL